MRCYVLFQITSYSFEVLGASVDESRANRWREQNTKFYRGFEAEADYLGLEYVYQLRQWWLFGQSVFLRHDSTPRLRPFGGRTSLPTGAQRGSSPAE